MLPTIPVSFLEEIRDIEPVDAGVVVVAGSHLGLPVDWGAGDVAEAGAAEAEREWDVRLGIGGGMWVGYGLSAECCCGWGGESGLLLVVYRQSVEREVSLFRLRPSRVLRSGR